MHPYIRPSSDLAVAIIAIISAISYHYLSKIYPILVCVQAFLRHADASSSIPSASFSKVKSLYVELANHHDYEQ